MVYFYDKNREIVMKLHDFSSNNGQEPTIKFFVDISYVFYKASRVVEDYKIYIESFIEELKLLYEHKVISAQFIPLERELEIYFKQIEFGHIGVSIALNHFNIGYSVLQSMLVVNYEIDQSFLPELISEIENILNK